MDANCGNCKYWRMRSAWIGVAGTMRSGHCKVEPKTRTKAPGDWCGMHVFATEEEFRKNNEPISICP